MNFLNDQFELIQGEAKDFEAFNNIYENGKFEGNIEIQFSRKPNPLESFEKEGEKANLFILREKESNKQIGLGACIIRKVYKDGNIYRMGYLTGLKVLADYKKMFYL